MLIAEALVELHALFFDLLCARYCRWADQQVADDGVLRVAQCVTDTRPEPAAVLSDVGQLVDVFDSTG